MWWKKFCKNWMFKVKMEPLTAKKYALFFFSVLCFFNKILEDISPFRGATDTPVLEFWWHLVTSALGFKARVDPLHTFSLVWSSDSLLLWHLLTAKGSAWHLSLINPCTCRHVHKHWWKFGAQAHDRACHKQHSVVNHSATTARLIRSVLAGFYYRGVFVIEK